MPGPLGTSRKNTGLDVQRCSAADCMILSKTLPCSGPQFSTVAWRSEQSSGSQHQRRIVITLESFKNDQCPGLSPSLIKSASLGARCPLSSYR